MVEANMSYYTEHTKLDLLTVLWEMLAVEVLVEEPSA